MLHEFITASRAEIITRCRARIATRAAPRPTDLELEHGIPLFLDQLAESLRLATRPDPSIHHTAAKFGNALMHGGFTIAQVVSSYGGVCQIITELAGESDAPITTREFQMLNLCLDNAIAAAVTEYGRLRESEGTERLGRFTHELRNQLNRAVLSLEILKSGTIGLGGSTGAVLTRSLAGLRDLLDRELADLRLGAGIHYREHVIVRDFVEDLEVAATMEANARGLQFAVTSVANDVIVDADRQILESVVANLLQNAFKFTRGNGHVVLRVHATATRVLFAVEDQCGGLPAGKAEELFRPFAQAAADRTGLGLGLDICDRGARVNGGEIRVLDLPGTGCVFTVDLPRHLPPPPP